MRPQQLEDMLDRLAGMRDILIEENGAELDFQRDEMNNELAPYALSLGLELLKCKRGDTHDDHDG